MSAKTMNVLVLLPVVGHPRDSKRISMLREAGFNVKVLAFERDYHAGRPPECEVVTLGRIEHGHYVKRVWQMLRALPTLRREIVQADIVYASGPDMACMALVSGLGKSIRLATEVGDIRRIQISGGVPGALVRAMDRLIIKRSLVTVITAEGFDSWYFKQRLATDVRTLLLENKQEPRTGNEEISGCELQKVQPVRSKLRIGYFGVLRCHWSLSVLKSLAESSPEAIEVKIAGSSLGTEDELEQIALLPNVDVLGPYQSPGGLRGLYSDVDLVWACYPGPDGSPDWREAQMVCRSNRFYESCFYERPLISLAGSGDGEVVALHDIGLVLEGQSAERVIDSVVGISSEQLDVWAQNIRMLPRRVYEYSDEALQLKSALTTQWSAR